jgi:hypothetical protein
MVLSIEEVHSDIPNALYMLVGKSKWRQAETLV